MKHFLKTNWFKLGLLVISLILLAIIYEAVVVVPKQREEQKQADEKSKEISRQAAISAHNILRDRCLNKAYTDYLSLMQNNSDSTTGKWNSLSAQNYVEDKYKDDKDFCYKGYPVNN